MEEILVPISFFATVIAIIYLVMRRKERMALIERGMNASMFYQNKTENSTLKWGLLLIMLGIGLLIANILVTAGVMDDELAYFSMLFLFGGAALLIYYFVEREKLKTKPGDKEDL